MNRKQVPKGKMVRHFGVNIFEQPKYDKLLKKKPNPPGMHGGNKKRVKQTEYGKQLVEKQKLKFAYGMAERQFRNIFAKAKTMPGITGDSMMSLLERRLDNVIFRLGLASTRAMARQMVGHGHIHVNGRTLNIPSYSVRGGDVITIKATDAVKKIAREQLARNQKACPSWMELNADDILAKVLHVPRREEIPTIANEQLVVELYAK